MILGPEPWTQPDDLTSFVRAYVLGHDQLVAKAITYPFEPKSIAYLRAGQFWAVPLSDGRFGCGCCVRPDRGMAGSAGKWLAGS